MEQRHQHRRSRPRSLGPWLAPVAFLPLAWCCGDTLFPSRPEAPAHVELADAPDSGVDLAPVVVDVSPDGALTSQAGRTLPLEPHGWQKRPPCDVRNRDEEAINGACYVRVLRRPPCKPAQYEHAGACFEAVAKAQRPNTSVESVPW